MAHSPPLLVTEALASRPFVMHLRNGTPRQAMDDVAWFFATEPGKCSWVESPDGSLTLREDAASRKARANRATEQRNARSRRLVAELKNGMRLGLLSEQELSRQSRSHPELVWAMPAYRRVFGILATLSPAQREAPLSGQAISLRVGDLGPVEQEYAQIILGDVHRGRTSVPPELGGGWIEFVRERDFPNTPLIIRPAGQPDRPGVRVKLRPLPGWQVGVEDLLHPEAPPPDGRPPWLQEIIAKREDTEREKHQGFVDRMRRDPQLAQKVTLRRRVELPDPKQPGAKVMKASDLADTLRQVADQTGLSVIGDYDPCWNDYYCRLDPLEPNNRMKALILEDLAETPAWEAMEFIAKRFRVEWGKRGNTIWVRSPRVPYALMDRIDLLDPPPLPNHWQRLFKTYKPGDRIPGVSYGPE